MQEFMKNIENKLLYSFWTHLPECDLDAQMLALKTYEFYKRYNLAFIKSMPNGMFYAQAFDCLCDFSKIKEGGVAKITKAFVNSVDDWDKINEIDIFSSPTLSRELQSLKILKALLKDDKTPILATQFSPLTIAAKISNNLVLEHIKIAPKKVLSALEKISKVVLKHSLECINIGCAGVFFAEQMAQKHLLSSDEYVQFSAQFNNYILNHFDKNKFFNIIHLHGDDIYFSLCNKYNVAALSYHAYDCNVSIKQIMQESDYILVAGIARSNITNNNFTLLKENIKHTINDSYKGRLILAPSCVIRYPVNEESIDFCIKEISSYEL